MKKKDTSFIMIFLDYKGNKEKLEKIVSSIPLTLNSSFSNDLNKFSYFLTGVVCEIHNKFEIFSRYGFDCWISSDEKYQNGISWDIIKMENKKPIILIYYLYQKFFFKIYNFY